LNFCSYIKWKDEGLNMVAQSKLNRKYNLHISVPDQRDKYYSIPNAILFAEMPSEVDQRHLCAPVGDQGRVGSCTGFMGTRLLGFDRNKQNLDPFSYSELFLYYKTRLKEGTASVDGGATIKDTIQTAIKIGVCSEELWPYVETNVTKKPPKACDQDAILHHGITYMRVPQNLLHMKSVIYSENAIGVGISVYESFEYDEVLKTGNVPLPQTGERLLGGHAILLVGFSDEKRCFIAQNSWGTGFGDQGYIYLPYDYMERHDLAADLWTIQTVS
jgi:C1A family cysteine protease